MIQNHLEDLVYKESGLNYMLKHNETLSLCEMLKTLSRVDKEPLIKCVIAYLRKKGNKIVQQERKKSGHYVIRDLINLKDKFDEILRKSFCNDTNLGRAVCTEYENIIKSMSMSASFLSVFIDRELKNILNERIDVDLPETFDKALGIFDLINGKYDFEEVFENHLRKRLLRDKTSIELEKKLIEKLETRCSSSAIRKLKGILKDFEESSLDNDEVISYSEKNQNIDLSVTVLNSSLWPKSKFFCKPALPKNVLKSFRVFKNYYTQKHPGRKLKLSSDRGTAEVRFILNSENSEDKVLLVNSLQMVVMLLFNHHEKMNWKQIVSESKIPFELLKIVLASLTSPLVVNNVERPNVLKSLRGTKQATENDLFYVNEKFTNKLERVKIPMVLPPLNKFKKDQKPELNKRKENEIDYAIMCIMRVKKKVKHQILMAELFEKLAEKFKPDVKMIKGRIEHLIDTGKIRRDYNDRSTYVHVSDALEWKPSNYVFD